MRVTNQMNNYNGTRYLTSNYSSVADLTNKIGAKQQITAMSDDPTKAVTGLKAFGILTKTKQYISNITTGKAALDFTSGKMNSIKTLLDDALKLVVGGANSATTDSARQANAAELDSIYKQILAMANQKDGNRYIFGGTASGSPPYDTVGKYVIYKGNNTGIYIPTGDRLSDQINATGTDAFGSLDTTIPSRDLNPGVNLGSDVSTKLSALNGGDGVPKGKITIYYSSYPNGLEVDLSSCDNLEDVKDVIERATLEASRDLNPKDHGWIDNSTLDWRDLQDRYVRVTVNPDGNGISLQEYDLGEPLPPPTIKETAAGIDYSGVNASYPAGGGGTGIGAGVVYDKDDFIYGDGTSTYAPLRVDNHAGNRVAEALGIKGTANPFVPGSPDPRLDGFIHGTDLNPTISNSTLLADLEGYNDALWTLINGDKPGAATIKELSDDPNNVFSDWSLSNVSINENTGPDGDLYTRITRRGPPDNDLYVEVFAKPLDRAKASDLVATGSYTGAGTGGTVVLEAANNSGLTGTVGVHLPTTIDEATMNLSVSLPESRQAVINVPAFKEQTNPDGTPRDYHNILSGWHLTGLDKPPANDFDRNHPASTDLNGNVSVNMRMQTNADGTTSVIVELCRPAYGDQPAVLVASGELNMGTPPHDTAVSGRIAFEGAEGFEGVGGSVYVEIPAGVAFQDGVVGTDADNPTELAYPLTDDLAAGTEIVLGGGMQLIQDQTLASAMTLREDTVFKAGQTFPTDIRLPSGGILPAGTALGKDLMLNKGSVIPAGTVLLEGTVLQGKQDVTFSDPLAAGTVIPAGSYTTGGAGFPAGGMLSPDLLGQPPMGFNLQATFATVEDLMRAVEEADIYASAQINAKGNGIEFVSRLGGAHLTVIEDTDCYEQMNDTFNQLSALDLNGLIKGTNTDPNGDLHTEVIYYPPDPTRTDGKVVLLGDDGEQHIIDAGYYVRLYSDKDALNQPYENRDNSTMVAEGFIPAGQWENPPTDPDNPFIPIPPATGPLGFGSPLILQERNNSGVTGTTNFDYYGGRDQVAPDDNAPYNNADLTITPGGLRTTSSVHTTLQEVDISGFTPGVHGDFSGQAHATISYEEGPPERTVVNVYRDSSRTHMVASGEINADTGEVTLFETEPDGTPTLDVNNQPIRLGSLVVADNQLADGQSDNFTITMGGVNNGGQKQEVNMWSTLNEALEALYNNDLEKLNELVDVIQGDIDRIRDAEGVVDAQSKRLELLSGRYEKDVVSFTEIWTSTVGSDEYSLMRMTQDLLAAEQGFNAAMAVSGRYLQMSILDYL